MPARIACDTLCTWTRSCVRMDTPLPDHFHHGPEAEREPCPRCGSTARAFSRGIIDSAPATDSAAASVTIVTSSRSTSWRVYSLWDRPEVAEAQQVATYTVSCERLAGTWLVTVYDGEQELGGGVGDDTEDAGLLASFVISEALQAKHP